MESSCTMPSPYTGSSPSRSHAWRTEKLFSSGSPFARGVKVVPSSARSGVPSAAANATRPSVSTVTRSFAEEYVAAPSFSDFATATFSGFAVTT